MSPLTARSRRLMAAVAAVAVFATTGCASGNDRQSTGGSAKAPASLVISSSGNYLTSFAPLWAAEPDFKDIEAKYKTKVSFEPFNKGSDALTALLGGSAQICNCGATTGLTAAIAGKEVRYIGNIFKGTGQVVVAAKKYEATHGSDVAKFANATFGYTSPGSGSQVAGQKVAEHFGLNWSATKQLALGSTTAYSPALAAGRVDIVVMDVPIAIKTVEDGVGYIVADLSDPAKAAPLIGNIIGAGLVTTKKFMDEYPELTQDVINALVSGINRVKKTPDPAAAYAALPAAYKKVNPDEKVFAKQWPYIYPSFGATEGTVDDKEIADTFALGGFSAQDTSGALAKAYFDNTLAKRAAETAHK
ncbi:ABC transporter substrate-binding protein [Dactylosporangium sp. NPDC000555]|uniref:ABC transporter substrate-binding protein n=1 Tax=Dactylosporangium sp. NPDC000555 TaxID=3154260 RepID=UPI003323662E